MNGRSVFIDINRSDKRLDSTVLAGMHFRELHHNEDTLVRPGVEKDRPYPMNLSDKVDQRKSAIWPKMMIDPEIFPATVNPMKMDSSCFVQADSQNHCGYQTLVSSSRYKVSVDPFSKYRYYVIALAIRPTCSLPRSSTSITCFRTVSYDCRALTPLPNASPAPKSCSMGAAALSPFLNSDA